VALACRVGIPCHHRVINELDIDLEAVFFCENAFRVWLVAMVGRNDRQPPDPYVDGELDDPGFLVPYIAAYGFRIDGRELFLGHVLVFLDRGDALQVGGFNIHFTHVNGIFGAGAPRIAAGALFHEAEIDAGTNKSQDNKDYYELTEGSEPLVFILRHIATSLKIFFQVYRIVHRPLWVQGFRGSRVLVGTLKITLSPT